jgi:diguanylate cyclase (GGDEF)-like protein/PAS domain S-box-containing protein
MTTSTQATHERRSWLTWPVLVFSGYTLYCAWYVYFLFVIRGGVTSVGATTLWVNLLAIPFEAAVALAAWYVSRNRTLDARSRRAWRLLAASAMGPALVNVAWVYYDSILGSAAFPSWMRLLSYSKYVFALWALLSFPRAPGRVIRRQTFLLDAGIVVLGGGVLAWHLFFRSILERIGGRGTTTAYMLAYPVGGMLLVFCVAAVLLRRPTRSTRTALRWLGASYLVYLVADVLFVRARVFDLPIRGGLLDALFLLGAWLAAAAAMAQGWLSAAASPAHVVTSAEAEAPSAPSLLPYAAATALFAALLLESLRLTTNLAGLAPITVLALATAAITAIVATRQMAAQRVNARLVAEQLANEARFRALVEHASDVILVLDADGTIRDASPSVARVLGRTRDALVGTPLIALACEDNVALVQADLAQIGAARSASLGGAAPCEWRLNHDTLGVRWMEVLCTNLLANPAVCGIVVNGRDVSERKALEAELTHRAFHDELTGLDNRARFLAIVTQAVRRFAHAAASEGEAGAGGVAVLYLDLDGFKPINDAHGHAAGDHVLATVAERIRNATRGSDAVARLGGDEFAVLIAGVERLDLVTVVVERILASLARPIRHGELEMHIGASLGVAWMGRTHLDACLRRTPGVDVAGMMRALLAGADSAMYQAKAYGGRRFVVCRPEELLAHHAA